MAENEITYIPYGQDEISQQDLMTSLANGVEGYLGSKRWAKKDKYRQAWLNAYQDIINHGLTGASNESGIWTVNHGQDPIDLNNKSNTEREMYQDAAYYIQQKMAQMTPRKKEEEKKKEDLDQILKGYGNNSELFKDSEQGWDAQDARGADGLRGTEKRRAAMIKALSDYRDSLNDKDFNFEGTSFKDKADLQTKIQAAIDALGTDEETDDLPAFTALGLPYRAFFNNGGNDIYSTTEDGKQITYKQYYENKQKAELDKINKETIANSGVLSISSGNNPIDAIYNTENYNKWLAQTYGSGQQGFEKINQQIQALLEKSYNQGKSNGLNQAERKQLGNLIQYIRTNNPKYQNYNLTPEEEGELSKHNSMKGRRLQDFVRLPWQTSDGRYTYADKSGNIYFLKPQNKKQLQQQAFTKSQAYNNYIKNFGKTQLQINNEAPVLSQDKDILISDVASMLGDIVSLGGGYAGAAGGITTLLSDLYGDIRRGKDTWGIIKNLGANVAWGAAGLIPGAKLSKLAKNAARVYAGLQSAGILMNDDVQKSWKNLIEGKDISARDFENFKWTLHAITGGTNAVRGHFTEKNIDKQIKTNNKPTIETKSGNKSITQEQVNKINKVGRKKGQEAAEKEFERLIGAKPKENTFNFSESGASRFNPTRYSQRLRNFERLILPKTTNTINQQAVNKLLEIDKSKPIIGFGNPFNKRFWTEGGPNRGGLTFALTPYRNGNSNSSSNNIEIDENPTRMLQPSKGNSYQGARPVYDSKNYSPNLVKKEYKNIIEKQNYTKNKVTEGTYKLMNDDIKVTESSGRFTIKLNNQVIGSNLEQKRVKEIISTLIKENKQSANKATSKAYKISTKDIGKILQDLKRKGWLKQGGTLNSPYIDNVIEDFFKK